MDVHCSLESMVSSDLGCLGTAHQAGKKLSLVSHLLVTIQDSLAKTKQHRLIETETEPVDKGVSTQQVDPRAAAMAGDIDRAVSELVRAHR